jgi:hypothetical protein
LRPLEDALHAIGLSVNTATLGLFLFATERLRTLGEAVIGITGLDVKTLQPRLNALKRYALAHQSGSEDDLYSSVFEPVFRSIADKYPHIGEFSVAATCEACEAAMAAHLGEPVDALREGLRPSATRGGQSDNLVPGTDANVTARHVEDAAPVGHAQGTHAGPDELMRHIRSFADVAGLGDCVELAPSSFAGFRLAPITDSGSLPPALQRAWWLLAGVSGQVDAEATPPVPIGSGFISWLADPADASATAFWEVLSCLRRTRGTTSGTDADSDTGLGVQEE